MLLAAYGDRYLPRQEIFAFISHDERLGRVSCHLYDCGPRVSIICMVVRDSNSIVMYSVFRRSTSTLLLCKFHVSILFSNPKAYNVCVAIGDAFKLAAEQYAAQKGNPFAAASTEREGLI